MTFVTGPAVSNPRSANDSEGFVYPFLRAFPFLISQVECADRRCNNNRRPHNNVCRFFSRSGSEKRADDLAGEVTFLTTSSSFSIIRRASTIVCWSEICGQFQQIASESIARRQRRNHLIK